MIDNTAIDWKKNMREELRKDMREELKKDMREELRKDMCEELKKDMREELYIEWTQEAEQKAMRNAAYAMLQEGLTLEMIGRITKLPLTEIKKLQVQRV